MTMFRIYLDSHSRKASHFAKNRHIAETLLPKTYSCIVKEFDGKHLVESYLVSWLGDHFKWDACYSESYR